MEKLIEKILTSKEARENVEKTVAESVDVLTYWYAAPEA